MGADYAYCYIYDSNKASQFLFEKMGYFKMRSIKFPAVSTYKKLDIPPEYSIKLVDKKKRLGMRQVLLMSITQGIYISFHLPTKFLNRIWNSFLDMDRKTSGRSETKKIKSQPVPVYGIAQNWLIYTMPESRQQ